MEDIEIKKLLENIKVEPSARCWESVASQLASSAAAGGTAAASVGHSVLASTAAKMAVGVISSALVAGGVILGVSLSKSSDKFSQIVQNQQNIVNVAVAGDSTSTEDDAINLPSKEQENDNVESENNQVLPVNGNSEILPQADDVAETSTQPSVNQMVVATKNTVAVNPSKGTSSQTATSPVHSSSANQAYSPNVKPVSQPAASQQIVTTTIADDPVLENYAEIPQSQPLVLEIPNVFTPNGDGFNDFFVIEGIENCELTKLIIRNRGGSVVFQSNAYHNNWDGGNLEAGTYYYQFYYKVHGIGETRTGTLTIVR
ncbi:MAG: gliding motility-associated C-terminal domain-containing protein [Bacteroidales bacterium]|nr:gliding motility-associated C-terminal domain-containing protein [Bacteroidales bacterium]